MAVQIEELIVAARRRGANHEAAPKDVLDALLIFTAVGIHAGRANPAQIALDQLRYLLEAEDNR